MKILIYSNSPWSNSAYGQQTAIFAPMFQALGHEVVVAAFYGLEGSPLGWGGIRTLPSRIQGENYSARTLAEHARHENADLVLTLCDIWVLDPVFLRKMPVAHWIPVDCDRLGKEDKRVLTEGGGIPVAMSRHGERLLTGAGFDPLYVPHGLNPAYREFTPDRDEARAAAGMTENFVIGMNAANQDGYRKGFFEQFSAFARFHQRHPEARLLVHTLIAQAGALDLQQVAEYTGILDAIQFADPYAMITGLYTPENVRAWYGVPDLYSGCSLGEGFGIPIVEAQASGIPVVTTDASATAELCGAGWKVGGEPFWNAVHSATWVKPYIGEIDKAYEKAWRMWKARDGRWEKLQGKAREFAEPYHCDRVLKDYWGPALDGLHKRLHPPVKLVEPGAGAPAISVCFASRGRPDSLRESVKTLLDLAADPDAIEVIIAVDPDDGATLTMPGLPVRARLAVMPERYGYTRLHDYLNRLAAGVRGEWIMWWNDDMAMLTPGWDKVIRANRPAILWPHANHVDHANIAPIWPRAWSDAMGHASPTTHMDTHLQRLGEALDRHDRIPVEIIHDRADVTGNHDDQTYAEGRKLLGPEGMVGEFSYADVAADAAVIRELLRMETVAA